MIPIRDTIRSKSMPVVNLSLIGINVVIFLFQLSLRGDLDRFIYYYGLVPARYFVPQLKDYFSFGQQLFSLISFMFLHGGFIHLIGNMWSLYIFGDNIEDRLGPGRYILFYLFCGLASGLSHMLLNPQSNIPTIGASGAIAGVMGAYFLLFPAAKVLTLIPIIFIPWFIEIPAFFFLGLWFLIQFINAAGSHIEVSGIAWWAHIGGFICGIVLLKLFTLLPSAGVTSQVRKMTAKKKSHRFQMARPTTNDRSAGDLHAAIVISPYEALVGARKLVNIPAGFHRRTYRVSVPPGIEAGKQLRLRGQGRPLPDGSKGDLMLKVIIQ